MKNTDFSQADEIVLSPIVELNLIHFNLKGTDFYDSTNTIPRPILRDTTEIKFLDDSTLQKSLKRVEFYFKFTNSISRDFEVDFQFLSETNDTSYVSQTVVDHGEIHTPKVTEFIDNVEGDDILKLTRANKVVVSVQISSSEKNLEGTLNLKSKATYFIEY